MTPLKKSFTARHRGKNVLLYAASENNADILYASRFAAPDPFIFLRTASGRRHLVMSDLEIDRARAVSTAHKVHSLTEYSKRARLTFGPAAGIAGVIATLLADHRVRSVVVPASFPVAVADTLRGHGIRVRPLADPLFPERLFKTPEEITEITEAFRATAKGLRAAIDLLRRSRIRNGFLIHENKRLTAEAVRSVLNTTVLAQGYMPSGTIVAPGKHGCDPHDRGAGVIRANTPVIIDVFPRSEVSGYFTDITRTVVRGRPSDLVKKMYRAVYDAQRLALSLVRHGVKTRDLHGAIVRLFSARGFETGRKDGRMQGFFHGTGHGLGLEIHEPPRIAMNDITLEEGMVVTIEPGLYYYPHGGVRIEDTVLVTRTGFENLTRFPKVFEIT